MIKPTHTLIQFSDIHIVPTGQLLTGGVDSLANIVEALAEVESMTDRIDGLIFSGDLTDKGDLESYERLHAVLQPAIDRLGVPVAYAMGNHDERNAFRIGLLGEPASTDNYDHVLWIGDLRIVTLDSTVIGHHFGELTEPQLQWLGAQLATPAPAGTIVVLHHPPIPTPIDLQGITLTDPDRFAAVLIGSDVRMILCGHAHHSSAGVCAGIPVWMAGATAYRLDALTSNLRAVPGGVYTRIDMFTDTVLATNLPIGQRSSVLYEYSADQLRQLIAEHTAGTATV